LKCDRKLLDSTAITKVQSAILITIIIVAAVGGGGAYFILNKSVPAESIKIGICADLDNSGGKRVWQAALLAADEVNAAGGVLGRNFTIVAEDDDDEATTPDVSVISNAMTKLITADNASFVISPAAGTGPILALQDLCAQQKEIIFFVKNSLNQVTQRVIDNYDKYKYTFRAYLPNSTSYSQTVADQILTLANYTGFTKVAFIGHDSTAVKETFSILNRSLTSKGLQFVYVGYLPGGVTDLTSYFAAAEESEAEILVPYLVSSVSATFVKNWYDRQSPFVVCGLLGLAGDSNFWDLTQGKCQFASFISVPAVAGYLLTNKTGATLQAYAERWGTNMPGPAPLSTYDIIRFILPDAIKRAGTIDTDSVIKTIETVDVETSMARHFEFASSHDVMVGTQGMKYPVEDYLLHCALQWQANRTLVVVTPQTLMREAGTTYQYPPWQGPWNN
jgi:branched-chain amino acid transport system substrate-binding protein